MARENLIKFLFVETWGFSPVILFISSRLVSESSCITSSCFGYKYRWVKYAREILWRFKKWGPVILYKENLRVSFIESARSQ